MTSADLLARCKQLANTPAVDIETPDSKWYELLTDAQLYWYQQLATHAPGALVGAPAVMTTTDGGRTWSLPADAIGPIEVYRDYAGVPLVAGIYGDPEADFVREGARTIRMTLDRAVGGFPRGGPVARFIAVPGPIDASNQPTLSPVYLRQLLVPRAVALWAMRGGYRDPSPYLLQEQHLAWGDPNNPQAQGLVTGMRLSHGFTGAPLSSAQPWWRVMR